MSSPPPSWQRALAAAITGAPRGDARAAEAFAPRVPPAFARVQVPALVRQYLPVAEELERVDGFSNDPLGEAPHEVAPGLVRRFAGRALLVVTGQCAIHCRYCFRRHLPYGAAPTGRLHPRAEAWLREHPEVREVILSGGDPLTLPDAPLGELIARLGGVSNLRRLRVHSRVPGALPERITTGLVDLLRGAPLPIWLVAHFNHPAELSPAARRACQDLVGAGIPMLNQSVLLRGVNDTSEVLVELCEELVDLGVKPYYLHQLDRVAGAAHFEVPVSEGLRLHDELRRRLSGLALPAYVRDLPGGQSKAPVTLGDDR